MAEAAMTDLVESVSKLLIHHPNLLPMAANELRQLMDDLNSLKAFFPEMAQKHKDEGAFRQMERQIKEVVYDVEDTINACLSKNSFLSSNHKVFDLFVVLAVDQMWTHYLSPFHTWIMVKQVKQLRERKLMPMREAFQAQILTLTFSYTWAEEHRTEVRKDYTVKEVEGAVFEDEKNALVGYLMEQNRELDVISITGMRGLGKTTLARRIYHDPRIKDEFPFRIWTHVSQKFKARDMFLHILRTFTREDLSDLSDSQLTEKIQVHLERERFLLVLDDVCKVDDWKAIKDILPDKCDHTGKVLVTTCDSDVGVYANVNRVPHKLRFQTEIETLELLKFEVSRGYGACPQGLKKIVEVIAAKCGGLPLQIVVVGGILVSKLIKSPALRTEREWLELSKTENLFLHNESSSILDVVELSYSILPGDLKDCFLYMGVFPEDYEISVWTLTRLWVAEGFVKPIYGQSLEDKAVQNLDDLITKNLVMVEKINAIGEVKTCRLHKMIRGFCVYKAREENLFQEIKRSEEGVLEPPLSELQKSRRLCLQSNDNTLLSQLPYIPRVRSFLSFNESSSNGLDRSSISTILDAFKLLKVLAIKLDHQQPPRLTKLLHLRFITLSVDDLRVLPESLSKLWNLQTLVVDTKSRLITIKANIWKMIWLRHLKTNATIFLSRKGQEGKGGENLQTLSRLLPECTPNVCERARNLKTLGIRGNLDNLFKYSLEKLHRLEKLKLVNEPLQELHQFEKLKLRNESILMHELPHCFPPNITRLTLSKTFLQWNHMSTLANIETLEVLKLKDNAFIGIYWNAAKYSFPRLGFLLISDTDLVHWEASPSSFPNLRFLVLKKCENLNEIPWEVAKNHLEKLDIEYVGESAVQSAKTIVEQKKHAEEDEKAEKAKWKHAEKHAEISKWKHAEEDEKAEKHAEGDEKAEKHAEQDEKAEISKWKHAEEDEKAEKHAEEDEKKAEKHAEEDEKAEKHAEQDEKTEISKWKHAEEDEKAEKHAEEDEKKAEKHAEQDEKAEKHAEEDEKAEKHAEQDEKAEISKWKLDEEDEKTKISKWKHEKVEKGNWRSPFKLTIGPGCY